MRLCNGSIESGEAAFIMMLRRLASEASVQELCALHGSEKSHWSRAVYAMARWLFGNWFHLVAGFPQAAVDRFPLYANAIELHVNGLGAGFAPGTLRAALFIDCNQLVSCARLLRFKLRGLRAYPLFVRSQRGQEEGPLVPVPVHRARTRTSRKHFTTDGRRTTGKKRRRRNLRMAWSSTRMDSRLSGILT
jgi:hypothetical protein